MVHKYESGLSPLSSTSATSVRAGMVGARGYSGMELVKILSHHPGALLTVCFTSDASGKEFSAIDELLAESGASTPATVSLNTYFLDPAIAPLDVVFLATPAEVSLELTPRFLAAGISVIDLSGAYRLKADQYPEWYGFSHTDPANLESAQYGLIPFNESVPAKGKPALIANPGCFVTSAVLALIPLLREKVIVPDSIVIDAKSGTTGAGKKAAESLLFSEVEGDCTPYKIGKHQHFPEIQKAVKDFTGADVDPFFTTQLLSTRTGILSAIYGKLSPGKTVADVANAFERAYANYPLVRIAPAIAPKAKNLLSLRRVSGTPYTNIVYEAVGEKLYVYSVLDNLMKGAASQAVENMNRIFGLPNAMGLTAAKNFAMGLTPPGTRASVQP